MSGPIVWGVDCAFRSVGVAVVELGMPDVVIHVETKLTEATKLKGRVLVADDDARCVREIATWLEEMANAYPPTVICAELPSGAKGAKAHHALGIAKGILCTFAVMWDGLPMAVCTPRELKKAVTGDAGASKEVVRDALAAAYAAKPVRFHATKKRWEHEADALGAFHACRTSDIVRMARKSRPYISAPTTSCVMMSDEGDEISG